MERAKQLEAFKRLRLGLGATPERFEHHGYELMQHWKLDEGLEAVDYLKQAVKALPKIHADALDQMFGFTFAVNERGVRLGLEDRRKAYGEHIKKTRSTVWRAEEAALQALIDSLNGGPLERADVASDAVLDEVRTILESAVSEGTLDTAKSEKLARLKAVNAAENSRDGRKVGITLVDTANRVYSGIETPDGRMMLAGQVTDWHVEFMLNEMGSPWFNAILKASETEVMLLAYRRDIGQAVNITVDWSAPRPVVVLLGEWRLTHPDILIQSVPGVEINDEAIMFDADSLPREVSFHLTHATESQ